MKRMGNEARAEMMTLNDDMSYTAGMMPIASPSQPKAGCSLLTATKRATIPSFPQRRHALRQAIASLVHRRHYSPVSGPMRSLAFWSPLECDSKTPLQGPSRRCVSFGRQLAPTRPTVNTLQMCCQDPAPVGQNYLDEIDDTHVLHPEQHQTQPKNTTQIKDFIVCNAQ